MHIWKVLSALTGSVILTTSLTSCTVPIEKGTLGGSYTWSNVAIGGGGYVTGMEYNPTEEGLVYARTDIGGLYRRQKDGNWVALTDFLGSDDWNYIGIESMATDPVEPNRVYFAGGTYMGDDGAIFASDDYGDTWTQVDMPFGCGGNQSGRGTGERLCVNPENNKEIWFGSRDSGMWKSEDYGKTWNQVESFPVEGNYKQESNNIGIMWEEFNPVNNDMYVGVAMTDGTCIYRTSDGETWEPVSIADAGLYPLHGDFSSDGKLYLAYSDNCGPNLSPEDGAVYVYDTNTDTATDITPNLDDGRYGGFGGISVDAQDPNRIVVCTLGYWSDNGDNLYYSTDGGATWSGLFDDTDHTKNYTMDTTEAGWLDWGRGENSAKTGWWTADININPFNSDEAMYGTGATIYSTQNLTEMGTNPVTISFDAYGLEETAVFKMVSPLSDGTTPELYSIMGDLTGFAHMDVTECPDDNHFMKNGTAVDVDCAYLNGNIGVYTCEERDSINYTLDGGTTWQATESQPSHDTGGQIAMSADGSSMVWIPSSVSAKPYVTFDFGKTWYYTEGLGYNAKIAADKVNPKLFYACCDGLFYVSEDGGLTFTSTGQMVADSSVPVAVCGEEGNVWLSSTSLLLYTQDAGKSFSSVKTLSDIQAIGFGKGKTDSSYPVIYALGNDNENGDGIYKSEDMGENWTRINDEQHLFGNLSPYYISGDSNVYGRVYLATNGRGIVMGELAQ